MSRRPFESRSGEAGPASRSASEGACLFCRIVRKEVPATIAYEDEVVLAFQDIAPKAPVHLLIIPKRHIDGLSAFRDGDEHVLSRLFACLVRLAQERGIARAGYRAVVNSGAEGGQTVFHLHVHLLGGRPMTWPPG